MNCPKCDGELRKVDLAGVQVDQCDKCAGVWFDLGELQAVLGQHDVHQLKTVVDRDAALDAKRSPCPRCGGAGNMIRLASLEKRGLHIDSCSVCYGQWLDGGEVEELRNKGLLQTVAGFFQSLW